MNNLLGKQATDKITGFKGIIIGHAKYLTGCDQYCIQPKTSGTEFKESRWFDEGRICNISKGIEPEAVQGEKKGCDVAPPRM